MTAEELPDSFDVLLAAGVAFFITHETRREIESFLRCPAPMLVVETIPGEELTLPQSAVQLLYSSTPETRRLDSAIRKRNEAETELL